MHNQSMRILFVLPLWQFWRTAVFSGTVICQGGNNAFWVVGLNSCFSYCRWVVPLSLGAWSHDRPRALGSYRAAILAALGELHQACGAGTGNFTLSVGFYQGIVQQG